MGVRMRPIMPAQARADRRRGAPRSPPGGAGVFAHDDGRFPENRDVSATVWERLVTVSRSRAPNGGSTLQIGPSRPGAYFIPLLVVRLWHFGSIAATVWCTR